MWKQLKCHYFFLFKKLIVSPQVTFRLLLLKWRRETPPASRPSSLHPSPSHITPPTAQYAQHSHSSLWLHQHWSYWSCLTSCFSRLSLRERRRSLCLTPLQSMQAAARVAQTAAHPGWWLYLEPVMPWGLVSQPTGVCTVLLTWHCSTTSATLQSSLIQTALVRIKLTTNHPVQCLFTLIRVFNCM